MAELQVQLSADIRNIIRDLNRVQKELQDTGKAASSSNEKLSRSFTKVQKGGANAVPTLQEFSRVIQDAPFGIQGVANNITQLTSNFGNLSKAAGGGRAALKLLLSSLSGPAGILFAVSAITSLLVSFGDELFSSANKAKKLQENLDRINDSFDSELAVNKEITKSLELQGKSTAGILGARTEILRRQSQQVGLLIQEQQELLNVQKEANATVTIFEALGQEVTGLFNKAIAFAKLSAALTGSAAVNLVKQLGIQIDLSDYQAASVKDKQKEQELQTKLNNLKAQQLSIENSILEASQKQASQIRDQISTLQSGLQSQGISVGGNSNIAAPILTSLDQLPQKFKETTGLVVDLSQSLTAGVSNAFANLGNAIAQGGNAFNSIGQAILSTLGGIITQMGQATIQAGVSALALSKVFENPFAAIAAGGLLVAIGSALSSAQSAVGSIGGGVGGQGSSSFSGSNYSAQYETYNPTDFLKNMRVEIEGTKLIAVQNRVNSIRRRNNSTLF